MRCETFASLAALALLAAACAGGERTDAEVATGLDRLVAGGFDDLRGKRVGVITNQTGVDRRLRHIADLIGNAGEVRLVALFSPEHGVRGVAQAGDAVSDSVDPVSGVPVVSLYGARRKPAAEHLEALDVLIYDIQDIGVRTYTYLSTLKLAMEAAAEAGIAFWVLDRPNPLGGVTLEGPVLEPPLESFVGPHAIPLRYSMTAGELARMMNAERAIGADLTVVTVSGWDRTRPAASSPSWVAPSPNIPDPVSALLYAGFVLIEGTNLSEGRGTTRPFRVFGAPWLDAVAVTELLERDGLPGVLFRVTGFRPTFSKYSGEHCVGIEVHVVDPEGCRPVLTAVAAIVAVRERHADAFQFVPDSFDRLAGTRRLREAIESGASARAITDSWENDLRAFRSRRAPFLLY